VRACVHARVSREYILYIEQTSFIDWLWTGEINSMLSVL